MEEHVREILKEDVKKLLKKKWFKWISRSFVALWLFMGCLSVYFFAFVGDINFTNLNELGGEKSTGGWVLAIFLFGTVPMVFLLGLVTYPYHSGSRGDSGSYSSSGCGGGCGGCGGGG